MSEDQNTASSREPRVAGWLGDRKLLFLAAAGLFLVSLVLPYWTARMYAPTYPEGALVILAYPYKVAGDVRELTIVSRLVGVDVQLPPDALFVALPAIIATLAALCILAAFRARWAPVAGVAPWIILVGLTAGVQYFLYRIGHNLAPDRPLRLLQPFTPLIIGRFGMGQSVKTYHLPHIGSVLYVAAALLALRAAWVVRGQTRQERGEA